MRIPYFGRLDSDGSGSAPPLALPGLLFRWLIGGAIIALIGGLFVLAHSVPGETVPILISAVAILGIGLASLCLWAMAVGSPATPRVLYGPLPIWSRNARQRATAPWFDQNGTMLWQRDGRGQWVRKVDRESGPQQSSEPANSSGYQ